MIQKQNPKFHKCLIEGRVLRAMVAWLTNHQEDHGFDRMCLSTSELAPWEGSGVTGFKCD